MSNYTLENGYEFVSTFPQDFAIADHFGIPAVKDTFNRAFKEWRDDPVYCAELVVTLNHAIWRYYQTNENLARVYNDLWEKADAWAGSHFKGEDARTYFDITD